MAMRVLPARTYGTDPQERRRMAPFGLRHPAKLSLPLAIDLMHRYTRPGQTWLDPFYGVGTTGLLVLHGRSVIGIELEAHHAEDARKNAAHLAQWARGGATATVIQGDSRRLRELLATHRGASESVGTRASPPYGDTQVADLTGVAFDGRKKTAMRHAKTIHAEQRVGYGAPAGTLTSPPYAESANSQKHEGWNALWGRDAADVAAERKARGGGLQAHGGYDVAGTLTSPPYADAEVRVHPGGDTNKHPLSRAAYLSGYDAPAGTVCSPPYGDVASRNRSQEPYASKDAARAKEYGQDDCARNVDGYGRDGAQIGNLPMGTLSSPPYGNTYSDWDATSNAAREGQSVMYSDERHQGARQNIGNIPYFDDTLDSKRSPKAPEGRETYLDAVTQVYAAVYDVTPPGGVLVLVTGNYIRSGQVVDLAAHTITVCEAVGWTPVERWRAKKQNVSFWRRLHDQRERRQAALEGRPPRNLLIDSEDVLCFVKGDKPGWAFADLPPQKTTTHEQAPMLLEAAGG